MNKILQILNEFRDFERDWKRYDNDIIHNPRPMSSNDFTIYISEKYNIDE